MKRSAVVARFEVREEERITDLRTPVDIRRADSHVGDYVVAIDSKTNACRICLRWDPLNTSCEAACEPSEVDGVGRLEQTVHLEERRGLRVLDSVLGVYGYAYPRG